MRPVHAALFGAGGQALLMLLAGCSSDEPDDDGTIEVCEAEDVPTWDNFAEGFVDTWCLPCHTESLDVSDRQGAPIDVNFDAYSEVYAFRDRMAVRVAAETAPMPPTRGITEADIQLFLDWVSCGAEGADDPPDDCAAPAAGGVEVVASQLEADTLCAGGPTALTSLEVEAGVDIGCVCAVSGDVVIAPGSTTVTLSKLATIGGSLRTASGGSLVTLSVPDLEAIGGDLLLTNEAALTSFEAASVETVGGGVTVANLGALSVFDLPNLFAVEGSYLLQNAASLTEVDITRLRSVGGAMEFTDLPSLELIGGSRAIEKVGHLEGGGLVLSRLDALVSIEDLDFLLLEEVHGDVVISDNPDLETIDGFPVLGIDTFMFLPGPGLSPVEIPFEYAIRLLDLPALQRVSAFGNLRQSTGSIEIRRSPVVEFDGFSNLRELGGDLAFEDLDALQVLGGFQALETVGGRLQINDNNKLAAFLAFGQLTSVGANLEITNNPLLPLTAITPVIEGVSVGGEVVVEGNL